MSIERISSTNENSRFQNLVLGSTAAGAVVGGGYTASKKNWLYNNMPSDTFVKKVSQALSKEMTSEELQESYKINNFMADAVNPIKDVESLKSQIRNSKELSEAIKNTPDEFLEGAIERVYSQPKDMVRKTLIDLQQKTKADKINSRNTALKLVNNNYDASAKKLVKSSDTSEKVFNIIKTTARKIQAKSIAITTALSALAAGAVALVVTDVPEKKN